MCLANSFPRPAPGRPEKIKDWDGIPQARRVESVASKIVGDGHFRRKPEDIMRFRVSIAALMAAFGLFVWHYAPILVQPRADQPGGLGKRA